MSFKNNTNKKRNTSRYESSELHNMMNFLPKNIKQTNLKENKIENDLPLKSVNGRRCLTKCYSKGETYVHPTLLTSIFDSLEDSCAVYPVHSQDPEYYKEYNMIIGDKCRLTDNNTYRLPDELESFLLSFYFDPSDFLAGIYELYTFDKVIYWTLENDYLPSDTIKRIHNCAWRTFGNKIEELSSNVLEYYYDIAKINWLKDYVMIIQNQYSFDLNFSKSVNIESTSDEIYDILKFNFFTYDFFVKSIHKYVQQHQKKWDKIYLHYGLIKKFILNKLIEHIRSKTKQED